MRRILIIGNSGGGKSTLARRLGETLGLPVIHLDVLFWKPGWVETDDEVFRAQVAEALAGEAWICDGNFGGSWDLRMPRADTIVWIDQPAWLCLARAIWRVVKYRDGTRPDMAEGCRETVDLKFYAFILGYNRTVRPKLEAALATHGAHARQVRLRSDREIAEFLAEAG
ncbi:MAG: topology modulation protein [Pseudomonadota bacterium]